MTSTLRSPEQPTRLPDERPPAAARSVAPRHPVLAMQSALGNRATRDLLTSGALQAKPRVDAPGDAHEREADRVADAVLRLPPSLAREEARISRMDRAGSPMIQRKCKTCEEGAGAPCASCKGGGSPARSEEPLAATATEGRPLEAGARAFFEPRFGRSFGRVRVFTDEPSARFVDSFGARAATIGQDILFASGEYAPETPEGLRLLAHELTHTVQQGGAATHGYEPSRRTSPGDRFEAEATRVAEVVSTGGMAPPVAETSSGVQLALDDGDRKLCSAPSSTEVSCASGTPACYEPDTRPARDEPSTSWRLTINLDVEAPTGQVDQRTPGHAWVKLSESNGREYTYGFYPQNSVRRALVAVPSCMRHPDLYHLPCSDFRRSYELTRAQHASALQFVQEICAKPETYKYHLLDNNCTTFVVGVMRAAGIKDTPKTKGMVGVLAKVGKAADSPNVMYESMTGKPAASEHDADFITSYEEFENPPYMFPTRYIPTVERRRRRSR